MIGPSITGAARIAGVIGAPVAHSLSPLIHNAWIAAAGLDGAYVPFTAPPDGFARLIDGLRHSGMRGLNVTLPFKETALSLANTADAGARTAASANLLIFESDGRIEARNTDGLGLLAAFAEQAPGWRPDAAPVAVMGAGGAARGAVAALHAAGAQVRVVNRTLARATALVERFPGVVVYPVEQIDTALAGCGALINATSAGLGGGEALAIPLSALRADAVVMDMVYTPLRTPLLAAAQAAGLGVVDGLAMLIGQARPSFEALYDTPLPAGVDVRRMALEVLEARAG